MQLSRGDRVKFLNDTGGGVITEIKERGIAMVLTGDGFEIPVRLSELIPAGKSTDTHYDISARTDTEEDSFAGIARDNDGASDAVRDKDGASDAVRDKDSTDNTGRERERTADTGREKDRTADTVRDRVLPKEEIDLTYTEEEISGKRKPERNLLFAFTEAEVKDELDLWLINDSTFHVLYSVLLKHEMSYLNLRTGMVEADTKIFIRSFDRGQINSFLSLRVQAIYFRKGVFDPVPPSQKEYRIDPMEIYADGSFAVNDFFDEKAFIVPLLSDFFDREAGFTGEEELRRIISEQEALQKKDPDIQDLVKKVLRKQDADRLTEEVDLHIGQLIDDYEGLSGKEVLDIQMARFTTALEGAIRGKTKRIVFIHGVGNGKLKFEIRKTLDKKFARLRYQDASFKEYGYGATMVIIRK